MLRTLLAAAVLITPLGAVSAAGSEPAPPPVHTLSVTGTGVGMYPAYDPTIRRYAATTAQASFPSNAGGDKAANDGASITVSATTSDPGGRVLVDGEPLTGTQVTLDGVSAGDEISVMYVDSAGREADSVYVLPADFPTLTATITSGEITPGLVGVTLFDIHDATMPKFAAFVDENGVPAWTRASTDRLLDLERQPNGHYSVAVPTNRPGRTGWLVDELGARFRHVAYHETVGLQDTDNHDAIMRADGSRVLLAYEPNSVTHRVDAVIQEVDASGHETFRWSSGDVPGLAGESVTPHQVDSPDPAANDYAHINSVEIVNSGRDYLASFRGLSAALLIARKPHDGHAKGDIVWKLGGRDSSFAFVGDPFSPAGGPCAQHTASMLPNGDVMVFDDGSVPALGDGPNCVDEGNPTGDLLSRPRSRVSVYRLDTTAHTATLVRSYQPSGWFSWFMGSAQYLPRSEHVVVGWAAEQRALVEEVAPEGNDSYAPVWRLVASPSPNGNTYVSYRALKFDVPDATKPRVTVTTPAVGATYSVHEDVAADFSCTDTGGSTLQTCRSGLPGRSLDTSTPGRHTVRVRATDGAGNSTTVTRTYTVGPVRHRPDVMVRRQDGSWVGTGVYGGARKQTATWRVAAATRSTVAFALSNRGNVDDRCRVTGTRGRAPFTVTYRFGGKEVTRAVVAGTWRSPTTAIGHRHVVRARIHVAATAAPGSARLLRVRCVSPSGGPADTAAARVVVP